MGKRRFLVRLPNHRYLDVYESGPPDAPVLLYHHPGLTSCLPSRLLEAAVHRFGLRFVAASRPGYADSTRLPGRSVSAVIYDSAAVLDALGVERCFMAGWSAGAPHALACGARLSERVRAVLAIASCAPYGQSDLDFLAGMNADNLVEYGKALEGEAVLRPFLEEVVSQMRQMTVADHVAAVSGSDLCPRDRAVFAGESAEDFVITMMDGTRRGVEGWLDDDLTCLAPWGFDAGEVRVPTTLWHGEQDRLVPVSHGQWLGPRVPDGIVHIEPDEGHFSIGISAMERMLQELVALGTPAM